MSPTPGDACPDIGNAYARAGDMAKSLDAFERYVSFDPRHSGSLFFLGRAYERAGRNAEAVARYSQPIELDRSATDSQLGLGRPGPSSEPDRRSVYGTLVDNARRLYVFDGIALREYLYELDGTGAGRPLIVTNADRVRSQRAIRETVEDIARFSGYRP